MRFLYINGSVEVTDNWHNLQMQFDASNCVTKKP